MMPLTMRLLSAMVPWEMAVGVTPADSNSWLKMWLRGGSFGIIAAAAIRDEDAVSNSL